MKKNERQKALELFNELYPGKNKINFPCDLANMLRSEVHNTFIKNAYPELMLGSALELIFETIYQSSLETDEGRVLKFNVAISSNIDNQIDVSDMFTQWLFLQERAFNVQELRRLAVCNGDTSAILVGFNSDGLLVIKGFVDYGRAWLDSINAFSNNLLNYFHHLVVRVNAPGSLELYTGSRLFAKLNSGKLTSPAIMLRKDMAIIRDLANEGLIQIKNNLAKSTEHPHIEAASDSFAYLNVISAILNYIQSLNHGGSLILFDRKDVVALRKNLRIKYEFGDDATFLKDAFVAFLNSRRALSNNENQPDLMRLQISDYQKSYNKLVESCKYIGGLSATDGAVLIDNNLIPLGFSAEIKTKKNKLKVYEVDHLSVAISQANNKPKRQKIMDVQQYGMRHRSSMMLCHEMQNVFSFVISQDGGVNAIWNMFGRVQFWKDIKTTNFNMNMAYI